MSPRSLDDYDRRLDLLDRCVHRFLSEMSEAGQVAALDFHAEVRRIVASDLEDEDGLSEALDAYLSYVPPEDMVRYRYVVSFESAKFETLREAKDEHGERAYRLWDKYLRTDDPEMYDDDVDEPRGD